MAACGLMLSEFAVVIQQCSQHLICKIPVVFCGSGRCSYRQLQDLELLEHHMVGDLYNLEV